jgi:two-component system response regulator GlrR
LIGDDPCFRRIVDLIPRIAASDSPVLITGETGTGKELVARAVHRLSARRHCPFVAVNCGAVPDGLFESELFGHVRGAFTDARDDHKGLARVAEGGVLFLDEVDGLTAAGQGKLLRFLEDRTFKPLGAERFVASDLRIMAATHEDIGALMREQRFRSDLYFRLNILPIRLVPLRERPADILALARHFLHAQNVPPSGRAKRLTAGAERCLTAYAWPGNVRELRNAIERATALADGEWITESDLLLEDPVRKPPAAPLTFREAKARAISTFERAFLRELLGRHRGNITQAAREIRQDRRALGRLVKKHDLGRSRAPETLLSRTGSGSSRPHES